METIRRRIFEFAYGAALGDATRQRAFEGRESQLRGCEEGRMIVQKYIDHLMDGQAVDFYRAAYEVETAYQSYMKSNDIEGEFRFGNAQKLINMTAKQMYITVYANEKLRERFCNCHCPMDGVMVEHLVDELDKFSPTELPKRLAEYTGRRGWKGRLRAAWSKITFDEREQYEIFQDGIRFLADRTGVSPIEYDYLFWG